MRAIFEDRGKQYTVQEGDVIAIDLVEGEDKAIEFDKVLLLSEKGDVKVGDTDEIVGMQLDTQGDSLLIVSEKGYGKRTTLDEFHKQFRGGKGVKCYKITEKTGSVIGVKAVNNDNEIMMITSAGIIIQLRMDEITVHGRVTSGVKMINLDKDVTVAKIAKVREKISDGDKELDDIEDVSEEEV